MSVESGFIELGHALGLFVVAEGVETAATCQLLAALGCDLAQGYFLCRPQPAGQLTLTSTGFPRDNVLDLRLGGTSRGPGHSERGAQ
jgi:EAL domain-containing protein (putative c-di-GMP-specific phosphodiesterase class I)